MANCSATYAVTSQINYLNCYQLRCNSCPSLYRFALFHHTILTLSTSLFVSISLPFLWIRPIITMELDRDTTNLIVLILKMIIIVGDDSLFYYVETLCAFFEVDKERVTKLGKLLVWLWQMWDHNSRNEIEFYLFISQYMYTIRYNSKLLSTVWNLFFVADETICLVFSGYIANHNLKSKELINKQ